MRKILQNKKVRIALIAIIVPVLAGVVLGIALNGDKDKTDRDSAEQDLIVHEKDENTIEETVEDGLIESDSKDGPVLNEENIIDFNGSDAGNTNEKNVEDRDKNTEAFNNKNNDGEKDSDISGTTENGKEDVNDDSNKDESDSDKNNSVESEGAKDTGSWGVFY